MKFSSNYPSVTTDAGILIVRTMLGIVFTFHGAQKLFGLFSGPGIAGFSEYLSQLLIPFPELSAYLAAGTELIGGIALLIGVAVRLAAIPLFLTMLTACVAAHGTAFEGVKGGMEYPLTLAATSLALAFTGEGRFSIRLLINRSRNTDVHAVEGCHTSV